MTDSAPRHAANLSGRNRRALLRLSIVITAAAHLRRREFARARAHLNIALQRGPQFSARVIDVVLRESYPPLIRLIERVTRTDLLPNGEIARVRAAVLTQRNDESHEVNIRVARVLAPKLEAARLSTQFSAPLSIARKRYIVVGSVSNPYVWMINSQLDTVGLSVHYVSGFSGVLQALRAAQDAGESPHVHLDAWLTACEATELLTTLRPTSTLSVTAHDLEQNQSRENSDTGASLLIKRADAIHLLTKSSLHRLNMTELMDDARVFYVPHPSYYGSFGGSYGLPQDRSKARRILKRDQREFSVGLVGRISDRKNVELLLEAAEELQGLGEGIQQPRIYISGSLRTRFAERIIRRSAALPNVTLLTDDLDDRTAGLHIAALDAAVVPYHGYLNSGWTLLALSAGVPIIASRESTAREVVPDAALTEFAEGDAHSLADAILNLAGRDRAVAESAARTAANQVHPNVIAQDYAVAMAARIFRQ